MRPTILNSLFAEIGSRKGVGPQMVRSLERLGITRVKDALFHLPTGRIDRLRVTNLDDAVVGQGVIVPLTAQGYKSGSSPKSPFRVDAFDPAGNHVAIVYFGRAQGIARKAFPLGEPKVVAGRLDRYGDMLQIVRPDAVVDPAQADSIRTRESVYPLTEGLTNGRMAAVAADALDALVWVNLPTGT